MTTSTESFAPIFLRVLRAMVDRPDSITIASDEDGAIVDWSFSCDVNDARKIVGTGRSRLAALEHLTRYIGELSREDWEIAMPCATTGRLGAARAVTHAADPATFQEAARLLHDTLDLCAITNSVAISGPNEKGIVNLHIETDADGRGRLLTPNETGATLIGALGTLWRGVGGRTGTKLHLEVSS